jgi:hypothetical protein
MFILQQEEDRSRLPSTFGCHGVRGQRSRIVGSHHFGKFTSHAFFNIHGIDSIERCFSTFSFTAPRLGITANEV